MSQDRRGSLHLFRLAGISVYLHWSWFGIVALLLLGFRGQLTTTYTDLGSEAAWGLAGLGSAVFLGSVLIHEMAHALMAKARGIPVDGITLYLFGGATEADASSRTASDELVIAIVGPLTSLGLAAVLGLVATAIGSAAEPLAGLVGYLAFVNLVLALFNLTPGLPLDGGRVFRALVWKATGDFRKATRLAATGGVAVGYLLIGIGLLSVWQGAIGGIWFAAIGWMISQSAQATAQGEELRQTFAGLTAADVMSTGVVSVPAAWTVAEAVRSHLAAGNHTAYPVLDGQEVVGMLGLAEVRAVPSERWATCSVGEAASPTAATLVGGPDDPMTDVIAALSRSGRGGRFLVIDEGTLVGIVSPGDIVRRQALADLLDEGQAPAA